MQICSKITLLEGPLSSLADCKEKITELQNNLSKKEAHMSKLRTSDRALRSLGVISKTLNEEKRYKNFKKYHPPGCFESCFIKIKECCYQCFIKTKNCRDKYC